MLTLKTPGSSWLASVLNNAKLLNKSATSRLMGLLCAVELKRLGIEE